MAPEIEVVDIAIPAVADVEEAQGVALRLLDTGAFLAVDPAFAASPIDSLPDSITPPLGIEDGESYLHEIRSPAAWNIRDWILNGPNNNSKVNVSVADLFYDTTHQDLASVSFVGPSSDAGNDNHGWHVSGIIGAAYNSLDATGVHPASEQLDIKGIRFYPGTKGDTWTNIIKKIHARLSYGQKFVLNTSLGYNDPDCRTGTCKTVYTGYQKALFGIFWRELMAGKQNQFIHLAAAGNDNNKPGGPYSSYLSSPWNTASRISNPCTTLTGAVQVKCQGIYDKKIVAQAVPELTNVIIVGSKQPNHDALSNFSNVKEDIAAVGEEVRNLCVDFQPTDEPPATQDRKYYCPGPNSLATYLGTSMATPQVAGVAAMLWTINPNLSVAQLVDIIKKSPLPKDVPPNVNLLDAYNALLAVDNGLAVGGQTPVRSALLDVVDSQVGTAGSALPQIGNRKFDEKDLLRFVLEFESRRGSQDYSRFDLNGDGYTGDSKVPAPPLTGFTGVPFDLNANHKLLISTSGNYETYSWPMPLFDYTATVDEGYLTDWEILCYYAFSDLYQGDIDPNKTDKRLLILLPHLQKCGIQLDRLVLSVKNSILLWETTPDAELYNFGPEQGFFVKSSTSSDCLFGERGSPVWSSGPSAEGATFRAVTDILNGAYPVGSFPNRRGCSSFVAYIDGEIWINSTVRRWTIDQFGNVADREYQARYFSGDPDLNWGDSSLTVGRVVNSFAGFSPEGSATDVVLTAKVLALQ